MTRTKIPTVYQGLSSPRLTIRCLSVQGSRWSETEGCSLRSHWTPAPGSPAPLGCLPPASLLKARLDLAAVQDRIKTCTSTQIPVSSHLHRRLNDFFPCLRWLPFLLPCSIFLYVSYKKKSYLLELTKMSHLFHVVFLMNNHPHFIDKESCHYNMCPLSTSIHHLFIQKMVIVYYEPSKVLLTADSESSALSPVP